MRTGDHKVHCLDVDLVSGETIPRWWGSYSVPGPRSRREEVSLRERFGARPPSPGARRPRKDQLAPMAGKVSLEDLAINNKLGFLPSDTDWLSGPCKELLEDDVEEDLLPAWHGTALSGPLGIEAHSSEGPSSPNDIFSTLPQWDRAASSGNGTPRSAVSLEPVEEDDIRQSMAAKAGEALLRHLRGGTSMRENSLFHAELPPLPPMMTSLQPPSKKLPLDSHFTEGLLGWQSGALDLRPSATIRRLSEAEVCTKMEMVMSRCWSSRTPYALRAVRLALMSKRPGYFLDKTFVWHHLVPGKDVCIISLYAISTGVQENSCVPVTFGDLQDAGLTPSQAFEAAIVSLDEQTKKCLIPGAPDMNAITVTQMSNAPSLYRIQAEGGCIIARLMLPCFVHAICGLLGCRAEELVLVPYTDEHLYATSCNEPFSMCALGSVTAAPRKETNPYLSSAPLRINYLPAVEEHLRVEWEPYPVWGTPHGCVSTDEFYQFPVPKSRKQARATMASLRNRVAPALVRYDAAGRITLAEAAELVTIAPPLAGNLNPTPKPKAKRWGLTSCVPTAARTSAPSSAGASTTGDETPDTARSSASCEGPLQRLWSSEVPPLSNKASPQAPKDKVPDVVATPCGHALAPDVPSLSQQVMNETAPLGEDRTPAPIRRLLPTMKALLGRPTWLRRGGPVGKQAGITTEQSVPPLLGAEDSKALVSTPCLQRGVSASSTVPELDTVEASSSTQEPRFVNASEIGDIGDDMKSAVPFLTPRRASGFSDEGAMSSAAGPELAISKIAKPPLTPRAPRPDTSPTRISPPPQTPRSPRSTLDRLPSRNATPPASPLSPRLDGAAARAALPASRLSYSCEIGPADPTWRQSSPRLSAAEEFLGLRNKVKTHIMSSTTADYSPLGCHIGTDDTGSNSRTNVSKMVRVFGPGQPSWQ